MKKTLLFYFLILSFTNIFAQDTTDYVEIKEVIVNASRSENSPLDISAMTEYLQKKDIEYFPALNADELLFQIPGVKIDRDFGIFSKNSSISMRGLNSANRNLVLLDGVPINKADGGGVNWSRINFDDIESIEIIKGPNSALYGGNAMGGTINIKTFRPKEKFDLKFKTFFGTYKTYGANLFLKGADLKNDKGFYWGMNALYRKGDGYITEPVETRDSMDTPLYLSEYCASLKVGYQFNAENYFETEYVYYDDKRGDGFQIFEEDGGYNKYRTDFVRISTKNTIKKLSVFTNSYFQNEHYQRQSESVKRQTGKYTLYNTSSFKIDYGILSNIVYKLNKKISVIAGTDFKIGSVNGEDNYKTTTDILINKGKILNSAYFAQFEINITPRFQVTAGLRYDLIYFYDGSFEVIEPSMLNEFMQNFPKDFNDTLWTAFSPKLGLIFNPYENSKIYISYGKGFRAGTLDDMCRNGNITKGFKLSNPNLKPENLHNFEIGYLFSIFDKITYEQAFYYSLGTDFQYFVATGDSLYTGGDNLKPVLQRQNVSKIEVLGTELSINYKICKALNFNVNYSYNNSKIKEYELITVNDVDLAGKTLVEFPPHQIYSSLLFMSKYVNIILKYNFIDKIWIDDINSLQINSHYNFDFLISTNFKEKYFANLVIQDIFNQQFSDSKGQLSPGRFFMFNLIYKI